MQNTCIRSQVEKFTERHEERCGDAQTVAVHESNNYDKNHVDEQLVGMPVAWSNKCKLTMTRVIQHTISVPSYYRP